MTMPPQFRQWKNSHFVTLVVAACVVSIFLLLALSGRAGYISTPYFDMLADAFIHGQLHLRLQPSAKLLALPDPYDPRLNGPYRLHDALLYQDRYYLYWGPTPALLLVPFKLISGMAEIADVYLVLFFAIGIIWLSWLLIVNLRSLVAAESPAWTASLGVLVAALGSPLPYMLARPAVYEAAILGGQCMILAALYLIVRSWKSTSYSNVLLILSGMNAAFAVGSRITLLPATVLLGMMLFWHPWGSESHGWRRFSSRGVYFCVPLAIGVLVLGWYNYARFGSWTETGMRYQLSSDHIPAIHYRLVSMAYIPANLYNYLLRPPIFQITEPFVMVRWGEYWYPDIIPVAPNPLTIHEPMAGVLAVSPWVVFTVVPILMLLHAQLTRQVFENVPRVNEHSAWLTLGFSGVAALSFAPLQFFAGVTMRYLADFTPVSLILATIGFWQLDAALEQRPRLHLAVRAIAVLLATYTVTVGVLLGLTGYYDPRTR